MRDQKKQIRMLIADSGSTKTDWALLYRRQDGQMVDSRFQTQGINPVLMSEEEVVAVMRNEVLPELERVSGWPSADVCVRFYGAGVRPDMESKMQRTVSCVFQDGVPAGGRSVSGSFSSDLLGAARALCGHREGIACILGTGANSCLYDGRHIVANTPALGFILGDEGGGAALGKRFLNAIFKGALPAAMRDDYLEQTGLTLSDIIRKVYREPMANRFLASTSLYIAGHLDQPELRQLVVDNFRDFFRRNIVPYGRKDLPVGFVGSMASHYETLLREAADMEGFAMGDIVKSPISRLCEYHLADLETQEG